MQDNEEVLTRRIKELISLIKNEKVLTSFKDEKILQLIVMWGGFVANNGNENDRNAVDKGFKVIGNIFDMPFSEERILESWTDLSISFRCTEDKTENLISEFNSKWDKELSIHQSKLEEDSFDLFNLMNRKSMRPTYISYNEWDLSKWNDFFEYNMTEKEIEEWKLYLYHTEQIIIHFYKEQYISKEFTGKLLLLNYSLPVFISDVFDFYHQKVIEIFALPILERYKGIYKKDTGIEPCKNELKNYINNNYRWFYLDEGVIKNIISDYMDEEVNNHYSLPQNRKYKQKTIDITPNQTLSIEPSYQVEESKKDKKCLFNSLQIAIAVSMVNKKTGLFLKTVPKKNDTEGKEKFLKDIEEKFYIKDVPKRVVRAYRELIIGKDFFQNISNTDREGVKKILALGGYTELLKDIK